MEDNLITLPKLIENDIKYYLGIDKVYRTGGDLFEGFIQTRRVKIKWIYEKEQHCCEYAEVIASIHNRNDMVGDCSGPVSVFKGITTKREWLDLVETTIITDQDFKEKYEYTLKLSDTHWIKFINDHNGYYSHNLKVTIIPETGETKEWSVSI